MTAEVFLERASEQDLAIFEQMERQTDTQEFVDPYSAQEHQACFRDRSSVYLRIVKNIQTVGFFLLVLDADDISVEFRRVVIVPTERGTGQAAIALMEAFCHHELRRKRIWLDVYEANARARHIYTKRGYRLFGTTTNNNQSVLYLEKVLS